MLRRQRLPGGRSRDGGDPCSDGEEAPGTLLKFAGAEFYFLMPDLKRKHLGTFMEETQLRLSENFYLPVYVGILTAREYVPYEKVLTKRKYQTLRTVI